MGNLTHIGGAIKEDSGVRWQRELLQRERWELVQVLFVSRGERAFAAIVGPWLAVQANVTTEVSEAHCVPRTVTLPSGRHRVYTLRVCSSSASPPSFLYG